MSRAGLVRRTTRLGAATTFMVLALSACGPSSSAPPTASTTATTAALAVPAPVRTPLVTARRPTTAPLLASPPQSAGSPSVSPSPTPPGSALRLLATLTVKGRGPRTGYSREQFGPAWADTNRNGCDTRNDILKRDLTGALVRPGTGNCAVVAGTLADPYTGRHIAFVKADATAVQIDHVIALSDAWQKGAAPWPYAERLNFANDPLNLLAVDGPTNMSKGDSDAASWLPPYKAFRCAYVARQVAVKGKYALTVTAAERAAMARVLSSCLTQVSPTGGASSAVPSARSAPQPSPSPPAASGRDPQFPSCRAARAAGYGPYVRGTDAEYDWYRDGDGDGTVCEI